MQHLHFITIPSADSNCASYSLELSAILQDANLPITHWFPKTDTEANQLSLAEARTLNPNLQESELLGESLTSPLDTIKLQEFCLEKGSGIIVLSSSATEELPTIMAFLRARIGQKLVLILHDLQEQSDDDLLKLICGLAHLVILPTFLDMTDLTNRKIDVQEVFAIPVTDSYPGTFLNAVQTSKGIQSPLVTVIVTAYNQEKYIQQALFSVQQQTIESFECIIVDDCSTDDTLQTVMPFIQDTRFKCLSLESNSGVSAARNTGIQQMNPSTEYVVFLDGDDALQPDHLQSLITALVQDNTLVGAYGQIVFINKDGEPNNGPSDIPLKTPSGDRLTGTMMATSCWMYPPAVALFHKWAVVSTGPFDTSLKIAEDWEWIARCLTHGDMLFTNHDTAQYRIHENNVHFAENYLEDTLKIMRRHSDFLLRSNRKETTSKVLRQDILQYNLVHKPRFLDTLSPGIKVGVVVAAYNVEKFLKATLNSLKAQTFTEWECVIVNDGSTDKTCDIAKPFLKDKRFRRTTQFNSGTASARNTGADLLSEEVTHILFLDADDILVPEALSVLLHTLQIYPHAPAVFGLIDFINEKSKPIAAPYWYDKTSPDGKLDWYPIEKLSNINPIITPGSILINRSVWKTVGPFDTNLKWIEDWGAWTKIALIGAIARLHYTVLHYRKHGEQKTNSPLLHEELNVQGPYLVGEAQTELSQGTRGDYYYDPLLRTRVKLPVPEISVDEVICTVAGVGYDLWLNGLLASLKHRGNVDQAQRVVFNLGNDPKVSEVAALWSAICIPVEEVVPTRQWSKSILYSAASILKTGRLICLDVDMLILGDISDLFTIVKTCEDNSVFVVQDGIAKSRLQEFVLNIYHCDAYEIDRLGLSSSLGDSPFIINDGIMVGSYLAFLKVENELRKLYLGNWDILERQPIRNQLLFNIALIQSNTGVNLSHIYNGQMHACHKDVVLSRDNIRNTKMFHNNHELKIAHYSGDSKDHHKDVHEFYRGLTPESLRILMEIKNDI